MSIKGFKRNFKPLEILTEDQVEVIHKATLHVLAETGVQFHADKALKLFAENGCNIDFEKKLVRFPKILVEDCLTKSPSSFRVKAREYDQHCAPELHQ